MSKLSKIGIAAAIAGIVLMIESLFFIIFKGGFESISAIMFMLVPGIIIISLMTKFPSKYMEIGALAVLILLIFLPVILAGSLEPFSMQSSDIGPYSSSSPLYDSGQHEKEAAQKAGMPYIEVIQCVSDDSIVVSNSGAAAISKEAALYNSSNQEIGKVLFNTATGGELSIDSTESIKTTVNLKEGEKYTIIEEGLNTAGFTC